MHSQDALAHLVVHAHALGFVDKRMEVAVEVFHLLLPGQLTLSYIIKFLLHLGREVVIKYVGEVFCQKFVDHHAGIGRHKLTLGRAGLLGGLALFHLAIGKCQHSVVAGCAFAIAMRHVFAGYDGRDCRSVGGGSAYAEFFHLLHESSLAVACRSLRKPFACRHTLQPEALPCFHGGKKSSTHIGLCRRALYRLFIVVHRKAVHFHEALEFQCLARSPQLLIAV